MPAVTLAAVLRLSRAEKLDRLDRLCPSDAAAIELLIDDCLTHRWPTSVADQIARASPRGVHS